MRKLTYKEFEEYVNRIVDYVHLEDDLQELAKLYERFYMDFNIPDSVDAIVSLLEIIMEDESSQWISYWVFDLDCGEKWEEGMIRDVNGTSVKLKTIKDLYRFLKDIKKG